MCGIIFAKNLIDGGRVNDMVAVLYHNQKERGKLGFGFIGYDEKTFHLNRFIDEKSFLKELKTEHFSELMIHHRQPTSTPNTINSTHPFKVEFGNSIYYLIHNGILSDYLGLVKEHEGLGFKYESKQKDRSVNDSEVLAIDFVLYLNGVKKKPTVKGSVALICLEQDKKTLRAKSLYYYHNSGSPLCFMYNKNILALASEGLPEKVGENKVWRYDYEMKKIDKFRDLKIDSYYSTIGFDYRGWSSRASWETDDDLILDKTGNISESINSYEDALSALEILAEDYQFAISDDNLAEADNIRAEAKTIQDLYFIDDSFLDSLGLNFNLIDYQNYDGQKRLAV